MAGRAVKVTLPDCVVECLERVYEAPPATALRLLVLDVLLGTLELREFDEECLECARRLVQVIGR